MTAKFGAARRRAFLAALAATGNQTLAAERAKVSRSWVTLLRSEDPAFGRAVADALAEAKARLGAQQERRPPLGWGYLEGEELVVNGTGRSGGGKRVQIARARLRQWSPRVEDRFLATLAATCNVKAAYTEVGLSKTSAYAHRRRWPGFQRRWDAAVEEGYNRLETGLIDSACSFLSGEGLPDALPDSGSITGMTVEHALRLLHLHKNTVFKIGRRPGFLPRLPDIEDVREHIVRKLEVLKRARALSDTRARDRKEWARRRAKLRSE